jgi:hypothetical protein
MRRLGNANGIGYRNAKRYRTIGSNNVAQKIENENENENFISSHEGGEMARFYRNLGTVKIKEEWELSKIG